MFTKLRNESPSQIPKTTTYDKTKYDKVYYFGRTTKYVPDV